MFGAVWAQAELRKVLGATGARVVGDELAVPQAHERFDADGRLSDEELRARLAEILDALLAEVHRPAVIESAAGPRHRGLTHSSDPPVMIGCASTCASTCAIAGDSSELRQRHTLVVGGATA